MNIVLIGLRGCGKSTVGRLLAESLGRPFVDLDDRVLATFDEPTVTAVWAARGEAAWRRAEARVAAEVLGGTGLVVALGGGAPMIDSLRARLEADRAAGRAVVIYLRCPAQELARRLAAGTGDRPPLTAAGSIQEVGQVLAARDPVYRGLADLEHDTTAGPPSAAAVALRARLAEGPPVRRG